MVMASEGHFSSDIWPKTSSQDIGTEEMILTIWYKEIIE